MPEWKQGIAASGQGAATGMGFGGPWGAVAGGVAGGIYGTFFQKNPEKEAAKLAAKNGGVTSTDELIKSLTDQSTKLNARGDQLGGEGDESTKAVTDYFRKLVGGDAAALLDATKVERGRVIDQYDTARDAIAKFGPRGGGSTSASAASRISEANQLSDITAASRTNAADKLAGIGLSEQGLGLSAEQLASGDIGQVLQAMFGQSQLDLTKRGQNAQTSAAIAEGLGTLIGLYLTRKNGGYSGSGGGTGGSGGSFPSTIYGNGPGYSGG